MWESRDDIFDDFNTIFMISNCVKVSTQDADLNFFRYFFRIQQILGYDHEFMFQKNMTYSCFCDHLYILHILIHIISLLQLW